MKLRNYITLFSDKHYFINGQIIKYSLAEGIRSPFQPRRCLDNYKLFEV